MRHSVQTFAGLLALAFIFAGTAAQAQGIGKMPSLPTGGVGIKAAVGVGFVDFQIVSPKGQFEIERGTYVTGAIERPFNVLNLHLVLSLAQLTADGQGDYRYSSGGANYSADDLGFKAKMLDLGLGLKWKLSDDYWVRPYIGGGGLGGYHEISYSPNSTLAGQGSGYKKNDTVMGAGYYGEAGLEISFTERFGVQLAARLSDYTSKAVETLGGQKLQYRAETYYFAGLIGF